MPNERLPWWGRGLLRFASAWPDAFWLVVWVLGLSLVIGWDVLFLNAPALRQFLSALTNSLLAGGLVVGFSLLLGWISGTWLFLAERRNRRIGYLLGSFVLNLVRSVPQIVGMLAGYVVLTFVIERNSGLDSSTLLLWMSVITSLVVFYDVTDLIHSRIAQFAALDFYPAMLCSGVRESRIVNIEILWKNSRAQLLQGMIAVFGMAVFLQCSIDFVLSVGLSTDVSATNFPITLGSLLATMDSKQDILAIGTVLTSPSYLPQLFTRHLQGMSVAFAITFTLLCVHNIGSGFVRRNRL